MSNASKKVEPVTPEAVVAVESAQVDGVEYTADGYPIAPVPPEAKPSDATKTMSTGVRKIMQEAASLKRAPNAVYRISPTATRRDN